MRKIRDFLKPLALIALGTLLLLTYLGALQSGDALLITYGIVAIMLSLFYMGYGVLAFLGKGILPEKLFGIFDMIAVAGYPFLCVFGIVVEVIMAQGDLPITVWIIESIGLFSGLCFAGLFIFTRFFSSKILRTICLLAAGVFCLYLILGLLFTANGTPTQIGDIALAMLLIYASYMTIFVHALADELKEIRRSLGINHQRIVIQRL